MLTREVHLRTPPTWPFSLFVAAMAVGLTAAFLCMFAAVLP